jgi:hypothetical protein
MIVLYGCETWFLVLAEEIKLGVLAIRVLGDVWG